MLLINNLMNIQDFTMILHKLAADYNSVFGESPQGAIIVKGKTYVYTLDQ